jgi:hypothetical protein
MDHRNDYAYIKNWKVGQSADSSWQKKCLQNLCTCATSSKKYGETRLNQTSLEPAFGVRNRQVFCFTGYKITKISYIWTIFNVCIIQDSCYVDCLGIYDGIIIRPMTQSWPDCWYDILVRCVVLIRYRP